jgi:hypothetical protein
MNEEEKKGNVNGVGPSGIRTKEGVPSNFKGGKDNAWREVGGMTYALKQTLEPI